MLKSDKIIKQSIVTEKATEKSAMLNQYTFEVYPEATKPQIKLAVEQVFGVKVTGVNVLHKLGKFKSNRMRRGGAGRTASSKRAMVTLKQGDKIELI